jgi:hypothetical protein
VTFGKVTVVFSEAFNSTCCVATEAVSGSSRSSIVWLSLSVPSFVIVADTSNASPSSTVAPAGVRLLTVNGAPAAAGVNAVNSSGAPALKFEVVGMDGLPPRLFVASVTLVPVNPTLVSRSLSRESKLLISAPSAAVPSRMTAPPASAKSATAVRSAGDSSLFGAEMMMARAAADPLSTRSGPGSLARLTVPSSPMNDSSPGDWPSRYRM